MIRLAGVSSFQWSASEQIWPFEKAADGSILYCKEFDMGYLATYGTRSVAHGISYTNSKIFKITGTAYNTTGADMEVVNSFIYGGLTAHMDATNLYVDCTAADWGVYKAKVQVIYSK